MPDLQEVFRLSTQKVKPDPGALDRQHRFQRRTTTRRKLAAFAVAAAIGVAAIALILVNRPGEDATTPADTSSTVDSADAEALEVATGFLGAFGSFNSDRAMTYLADDADITGMTEGMGVDGLSLMTSFLQAQGYQQSFTSCEAATSASDTSVVCEFDFHAIRSDEIGRGPFSGSTFDLIVRDGEIVRAAMYLEIEEFSPQMWEPFRDWVSSTYPKDFNTMYVDGGSNFRLTEESIRLWEQRTREYVKEVKRGTEGQLVQGLLVDYVVDLDSGEMTPLPEAIIRSLGETAEGVQPESHYAASARRIPARLRRDRRRGELSDLHRRHRRHWDPPGHARSRGGGLASLVTGRDDDRLPGRPSRATLATSSSSMSPRVSRTKIADGRPTPTPGSSSRRMARRSSTPAALLMRRRCGPCRSPEGRARSCSAAATGAWGTR